MIYVREMNTIIMDPAPQPLAHVHPLATTTKQQFFFLGGGDGLLGGVNYVSNSGHPIGWETRQCWRLLWFCFETRGGFPQPKDTPASNFSQALIQLCCSSGVLSGVGTPCLVVLKGSQQENRGHFGTTQKKRHGQVE